MTNDRWVAVTQQVQITLMVSVVKVCQRGCRKGVKGKEFMIQKVDLYDVAFYD